MWTRHMKVNYEGPEVAESNPGPTASKEKRPQSYNGKNLNTVSNCVSLNDDPELQKGMHSPTNAFIFTIN